jgi:glycosyltransferase 2 family protein
LEGLNLNLGTHVKAIAVLLLLSVGVFLLHIYWINIAPVLKEILGILKETRLRYVIMAILVYILSVYLFAVRWRQVLACIGYDLKASSLLPVYFGAIFINNITPGGNLATGESFRILWANKRFGISYKDAFKTVFFERLVEAIPISLLSFYIIFSIPSIKVKFLPLLIDGQTLNSVHLLLVIFLVLAASVWYFREKFTVFLIKIQKNLILFRGSFIPALLLSCAVWILDVIRLKLVALALNIDLSLNLIITVSILSFLLGALPFTPGGLGIVEGGLVSLLLYLGLPFGPAGSFVFLERIISYGISSLIGFLYLSYYGGFHVWEKAKKEKRTIQ